MYLNAIILFSLDYFSEREQELIVKGTTLCNRRKVLQSGEDLAPLGFIHKPSPSTIAAHLIRSCRRLRMHLR